MRHDAMLCIDSPYVSERRLDPECVKYFIQQRVLVSLRTRRSNRKQTWPAILQCRFTGACAHPHSLGLACHMTFFAKTAPQAWIACSGVESTENPSVWLLALLQQACRSFEPLRSRNQGPLAGEGCTSSLIRMTSGSALYLTHRDSTS
jgi:hypothetical protein